ncbi:MAG: SBBP repeat-containing protein, partial [Nitrospirae bacterium]|nr:SBBP repeat-containing protein [Nitrospirota bacterium]
MLKLNSTGTALSYSTFIGGSYDEGGVSIAVDGGGNAYVTGDTSSLDFPATTGAYDTTHNGSSDVFVLKLNSTGTVLSYSTFIGGSYDDNGNGIAVDGDGNAYVIGDTWSSGFPTTGGYDTTYNGSLDVFVLKLNSTGTALSYSTFVGGSSDDIGFGIVVDGGGNAHVTGWTYSPNFPTTTGAYDRTHNGSSDVFVLKLNSTGTALSYSTFIGGSYYDFGAGIALDGVGNAYVSGDTWSTDFPTTTDAYSRVNKGLSDVFVLKLNSTGTVLSYSTLIGGNSHDYGYSIVVDGLGSAYISSHTRSTDFPTTTGAYDRTHNGYYDVFVLKLDFGPVDRYPLTVSKTGTGTGTVTSSPVGINCGADCTEPYNPETVVALTAISDIDSVFTVWSGACTGSGACIVTMNEA